MSDELQRKIDDLYYHFDQFYRQGRFEEAKEIATKVTDEICKKIGDNRLEYAKSLYPLAFIHKQMGNHREAAPILQKILKIQENILGQNNAEVAATLNNLGTLYLESRNYKNAEEYYLAALRMQPTIHHKEDLQALKNLAVLYHHQGNYAKAIPFYQKLCETQLTVLGKDHPDYPQSLKTLGDLYHEIGDVPKATSLYVDARDIISTVLGENHPEFADVLNSIAGLLRELGGYSEAEPLYQKALEIRRNRYGEEHSLYAQSLKNLGLLYSEMGKYDLSEYLYHKALEIVSRSRLGESNPGYAFIMNDLACLYYKTGKYNLAEAFHKKALEIRRTVRGEKHPDYIQSLNNLAALYAATNRYDEALALLENSVNIYSSITRQVFSIASDVTRMNYLQLLRHSYSAILSLIYRHFSDSPDAVSKAIDLILRRKGLAAEAVAAQRDAIISGKYPELKTRLHEMNSLRMKVGEKILAGPAPGEDPESYMKNIEEMTQKQEILEQELANQIPEIRLEQEFYNVNKIANSLQQGSVLIEFVQANIFDFSSLNIHGKPETKPSRYLAFVIHAGSPADVQMIDLGETDTIDQQIFTFRSVITGEDEGNISPSPDKNLSRRDRIKQEGFKLRIAIFDPLLNAIRKQNRLFIAPDGNLTRVPFEVLPIDDGVDHRLIDEYYISYLNTGRDLLRFDIKRVGVYTKPVIAANPDFDMKDGQNHPQSTGQNKPYFRQLKGTEDEAKLIANLLKLDPLLGKCVTESRIKYCVSPRILHLATHGFFRPLLPNYPEDNNSSGGLTGDSKEQYSEINRITEKKVVDNPLLYSGLALAGANTWLRHGSLPPEAEDGILTAEDVSGMDLSNTELVVLSACKTGLGHVIVGEGVFGLQRSFVLSGAQTLIMSLWKVPDKKTQELMVDFYNHILAGTPRAEALRQAQLSMKKKYPDPYHWGAFICQGNPAPLSNSS
jgi:CHAT domain-containing protein/Tfp pilus assembly protein PilF